MIVSKKTILITLSHFLGILLGGLASSAQAQVLQPLGPIDFSHDTQLFAPVELDFGNEPTGRTDGYFFGYDKTYWSATGERVAVGDPNVQREVHPVYFDNAPNLFNNSLANPTTAPDEVPILNGNTIRTNPNINFAFPVIVGRPVLQSDLFDAAGNLMVRAGAPINPDTGNPILRPVQQSGIRSSAPSSIFAFGDRYEVGYMIDGRGWLLGILDGPQYNQSQTFGFNGGSQQDTVPSGLRSPLGDVYVAFNYQEGLMHGFLDVFDGTAGVGRILPSDNNGDGIADGDGFADDLDADGQFGPDLFDSQDPLLTPEQTGGAVDVIVAFNDGTSIVVSVPPGGTTIVVNPNDPTDQQVITAPPGDVERIPDYDDLVELPTSFGTLTVRNIMSTTGVELMKVHQLSNRHFMKTKQNNHLEIFYGARFLRMKDNFAVGGNGGVLGQSFWDTTIDNNLIGPQVAVNWSNQNGRWSTNVQGRFMFGYNVTNWEQIGGIGEDLIQGRHNHPLYLRPTTFTHGRQDHDFSPVAELRIDAKYSLTKSIALKAGYTGYFVDNIRRAASHIDYTLPYLGFVDGGTENIMVNGLNFGVEINH